MSSLAREVFDELLRHYGPPPRPPGDSPWEVAVASVLVQQSSWPKVKLALTALRDNGWLTAYQIYHADLELLGAAIQPAGHVRQKVQRLRRLAQWVEQEYGGNLQGLFDQGLPRARQKLLALQGIGPETADSILLHAGHLPCFVVDTYTARILKRHGWMEEEAGYDELQDWFIRQLPDEPQSATVWSQFHEFLVRVGKEHCQPRARCEGCPLQHRLCYPIVEDD